MGLNFYSVISTYLGTKNFCKKNQKMFKKRWWKINGMLKNSVKKIKNGKGSEKKLFLIDLFKS